MNQSPATHGDGTHPEWTPWTLEELLKDLDGGDYLYLTPTMGKALAAILRQNAAPQVPQAARPGERLDTTTPAVAALSEKAAPDTRLEDALDDVKRLHGDKMRYFERVIELERQLAYWMPKERPAYGAVGSRDVDVAEAQRKWDAFQAAPLSATAVTPRRWRDTKVTVPCDGDNVLGYWAPNQSGPGFDCDVVHYYGGHWHEPDNDEDDFRAPDFWMPLPEAPK